MNRSDEAAEKVGWAMVIMIVVAVAVGFWWLW